MEGGLQSVFRRCSVLPRLIDDWRGARPLDCPAIFRWPAQNRRHFSGSAVQQWLRSVCSRSAVPGPVPLITGRSEATASNKAIGKPPFISGSEDESIDCRVELLRIAKVFEAHEIFLDLERARQLLQFPRQDTASGMKKIYIGTHPRGEPARKHDKELQGSFWYDSRPIEPRITAVSGILSFRRNCCFCSEGNGQNTSESTG